MYSTYQNESGPVKRGFVKELERFTRVRNMVSKENPSINQPVREIYADYRYELLKVGMTLNDMSLADASAESVVDELLLKGERLEALVDLYAYLLACEGHGQRL